MDPAVTATLITAISSVAIAVIGKIDFSLSRGNRKRASTRKTAVEAPSQAIGASTPSFAWPVTVAAIAIVTIGVTFLVHHDLGVMTFFWAPLVLLCLAYIRPIRPIAAAAWSLAPFAFAFASEPLYNAAKRLPPGRYDAGDFWLMGSIVGGTAAATIAMCLWRLRRLAIAPPNLASPAPRMRSPTIH